jgi:hypothetical protein
MDELVVPLYYVVNRYLPLEEAGAVMSALRITPVHAAIVSDHRDAQLGLQLAPHLMLAEDEKSACMFAAKLARESGRPLLVVGEADFLDAVYPDGKREALAKHA